MSTFGDFLKKRRAELRLSLRAFCERSEIDASNWSKLERGRLPPPRREKLDEYVRLLGLEEGTDSWYEFFDLAAAEAGRIPEDLRDEEVIRKLPVLFRTLREADNHGGADSEALFEELVRKIRGA